MMVRKSNNIQWNHSRVAIVLCQHLGHIEVSVMDAQLVPEKQQQQATGMLKCLGQN